MNSSPCLALHKNVQAESNSGFSPFSLENKSRYLDLYKAMPAHPIAYALPNLWGWLPWMQLEMCFTDDLCWLRCSSKGYKNFAPIGSWHNIDWKSIQKYLLKEKTFYQIPQELLTVWQEQLDCKFEITESRDYWEYIYNTSDLANLAGSKYHMQRNHVNAYIKINGEPDYRNLDMTNAAEIYSLHDEWYDSTEKTQTVMAEREALHRVLAHWHDISDLVAGGIYLQDKLVAFSIGYELAPDTLGVLYEKAKPDLRGAFPIMTRSFARNAGANYAFLNRAEDMGDEGMRKAKNLYRPVKFEQLYTVSLTQ